MLLLVTFFLLLVEFDSIEHNQSILRGYTKHLTTICERYEQMKPDNTDSLRLPTRALRLASWIRLAKDCFGGAFDSSCPASPSLGVVLRLKMLRREERSVNLGKAAVGADDVKLQRRTMSGVRD